MAKKLVTHIAIGLAILASSASQIHSQGIANVVTTLKNLPAQLPELPEAAIRESGNTVEAIYNGVPKPPNRSVISQPLVVQITLYSTIEEAEGGVQLSLKITSVGPTHTQQSGESTIYIWDQYGYRKMTRVGLYVVSAQSVNPQLKPIVEQAFDLILRDLSK